MVLTKETFSSLDMSKGPPIVLGYDSLTDSLGKGRIDLDHGKFNNVLYVPSLASVPRSVQFQEELLIIVEVGEPSSPP